MIIKVVSITLTTVGIIQYYERKHTTIEDLDLTCTEKISKKIADTYMDVKKVIHCFPMLLSSLIFQSGTLILLISIFHEYSVIFMLMVLLGNFIICHFPPYSWLFRIETKFQLQYKYEEGMPDEDMHGLKSILMAYSNLFLIMRGPIENMTHYRSAQILLMQPLRFTLNFIILIAMFVLTWAPHVNSTGSGFQFSGREVILTAIYVLVILSGLFNLFEMIRYFYRSTRFFKEDMFAIAFAFVVVLAILIFFMMVVVKIC